MNDNCKWTYCCPVKLKVNTVRDAHKKALLGDNGFPQSFWGVLFGNNSPKHFCMKLLIAIKTFIHAQ